MAYQVFYKSGATITNEQDGSLFQALTTGGNGTTPSRTQGVWKHPDGGPGGLFAATGSTSPVTVSTGWATVASKVIYVDAAVSVTVPTPTTAARKDRIVLRYTWATQTADIYLIQSEEGASDYADYTTSTYQNCDPSNVVWCIPLWKVDVTTGGAITLTDERYYIELSGQVDADAIQDGACLAEILDDDGSGSGLDADLLDGAHGSDYAPATKGVTNGDSHDHSGGDGAQINHTTLSNIGTNTHAQIDTHIAATSAHGAVGNILGITTANATYAPIAKGVTNGDSHDHSGGDGAPITAGGLADGAVNTTAKLANDIVDDTKVGDRVPQLYRRQGGDGTNWAISGTTTYTPGAVRIQCGSTVTEEDGHASITFPTAYSGNPLVFGIVAGSNGFTYVGTISTTSAVLYARDASGSLLSWANIFWLTIGPE